MRRGGFPTEDDARTALHRYRAGRRIGVSADPNQTVADYLIQWLAAKRLRLKPTTWVHYRDYVHHDLIPALGPIRLDELAYEHIHHFVLAQLATGRGRPTVWHIIATLSSAIGDAVRQHRLPTNVVRPTVIPRPASGERTIWTPAQAIRFLRHCHANDPDFGDLIEFLIGTGLRKGEALGLHWDDVHLHSRTLYVRWTLSAIDNNKLALTRPKTRKSSDWVALSPRIHAILTRRKTQPNSPSDPGGGFVFHREDGRPLHPEYVLNHFHYLARQAGVRRTSVHDLRHLAATLALTHGVELTIVSKTLRHSTISTTANIYGHLTKPAARQAVDLGSWGRCRSATVEQMGSGSVSYSERDGHLGYPRGCTTGPGVITAAHPGSCPPSSVAGIPGMVGHHLTVAGDHEVRVPEDVQGQDTAN